LRINIDLLEHAAATFWGVEATAAGNTVEEIIRGKRYRDSAVLI